MLKRAVIYRHPLVLSSLLPPGGGCAVFPDHSGSVFKALPFCHRPHFHWCFFNVLVIESGVPAPSFSVLSSSGSECDFAAPVSLSERWWGRCRHHHFSGHLTVTSLAAKLSPSTVSFRVMTVNTSSSPRPHRETVLGRERASLRLCLSCYLRMSWSLIVGAQRKATVFMAVHCPYKLCGKVL